MSLCRNSSNAGPPKSLNHNCEEEGAVLLGWDVRRHLRAKGHWEEDTHRGTTASKSEKCDWRKADS